MKTGSFIASVAAAVAIFTPGSLASLKINNWCNVGVSMVISQFGGCDTGVDGRCIRDGSQPWRLGPGNGGSILNHPWRGEAVSLKISKNGVPGVLQFEYSRTSGEWGGLWWDLSDLDGKGNGLVGTPFAKNNVGVSPTGNGSGKGTCVKIRCRAGKVCLDSYQHPDDPNTKYCPANTGNMWLDLCMPGNMFNQRLETLDDKNKHNMTDSEPPASFLALINEEDTVENKRDAKAGKRENYRRMVALENAA